VGCEHPQPVEGEPEEGAERQADHVGRDVVGEDAREAEQVVRDPQAREADQHAAEAHDEELDELAPELAAAVLAEGPVPVADPVRHDREGGRDDLRQHGPLVQVVGREHGRAEQIEHGQVDDETYQTHHAESRELPDELAHPSCLTRPGI